MNEATHEIRIDLVDVSFFCHFLMSKGLAEISRWKVNPVALAFPYQVEIDSFNSKWPLIDIDC